MALLVNSSKASLNQEEGSTPMEAKISYDDINIFDSSFLNQFSRNAKEIKLSYYNQEFLRSEAT
jgi:hypothetical protein